MRRIALLVLGAWAVLLIAAAGWATGLNDVKSDREVDYLPSGAESTTVADLESKLPGGAENAFVVVYHRSGGITAADRRTAESQRATLAERYGADGGPVVPSADGAALLFTVPVSAARGEPSAYIEEFRSALDDRPAGLDAKVTGPGALGADFEGAFEGIDEQLLIVTALVVTVLLLLTYRSPVLWLVPLVAVGAAAMLAMAAVYALAKHAGVVVSEQSAAILTILVFGVGTDYALLLVARYREELRRHRRPADAMLVALRRAAPAIAASAATVVAGLMCLLAADMNSTRGMGPVGAAGIVCALLAMLTLFPALLVLGGRRLFWPRTPRPGVEPARAGVWDRLGGWISRRRLLAAVVPVVFLGALTVGLTGPTQPLRQADQFVNTPESVTGMAVVAEHFPQFGGQPLTVMARDAAQTLAVVKADPGVASVESGRSAGGYTELTVFPKDAPDSAGETATIERLRASLTGAAYVGGPSAASLDQAEYSGRDARLVIPLILLVVTAILALLLRSLAAPLGLVLTVVLSFAAAMGATVWANDVVFGFEGIDPGLTVLGFLFLVALGVDYNIFLMSRAREESAGSAPNAAYSGRWPSPAA